LSFSSASKGWAYLKKFYTPGTSGEDTGTVSKRYFYSLEMKESKQISSFLGNVGRNCFQCGKPGHLRKYCKKEQGPQQGGKFMKKNAAMVGQGVKFAMSIQDILLESDDEDNVRSVVIAEEIANQVVADDIAVEGTAGNVEGKGTASLMEDSTFSEENSSDYLSMEDRETEVLHEDGKFVCSVISNSIIVGQ